MAEVLQTDPPAEVRARPGLTYFMGYGLMAPLARFIYRPRVFGRENVPRNGPVILASNHLAFIDNLVIPMTTPRPVMFLAKSEYFTGSGCRGAASRWFFTSVGAVPVTRGAGQAAQEALDAGRAILDTGSAFAVYPEGTRSLDGRLYRGRTGVGWLALSTGVPVVPVGLIGTEQLQPRGTTVPRLHRITVRFGAPMDFSGFGPADSGRARRRVTDEVMTAIQKLTGQARAAGYNEAPPITVGERVRRMVFSRERT